MKKTLCGIAIGLGLAGSTAQAADLMRGPSYSPVASSFSWIGPYLGANAGYAWGTVTNNALKPSGLEGGVQGGYNWQSNQFVFGLEADIQASGASDSFAGFQFSNPWFSTLRGRAGWAMNNILFYGTLGFALGSVTAQAGAVSESKTQTGWAGGLGAEIGLTQNWSAKVEYMYLGLGERAYTLTGVNNGLQMNLLRLGVNYHF